MVDCKYIEGKGRSLFATEPLDIGCHPLVGLCQAIAHPVLIESMRKSRCAYCFQPTTIQNHNTSSLHCHCSHKCQATDKNWLAETHAMKRLPSPPSPTVLSCSRILRQFKESPESMIEYNKLCYNIDLLSEEEKESYMTIMNQCHIFLRAMEDTTTAKMAYDMIHPDPTPAFQFMSRMSMNGFTISNSEQRAIGHGLYVGAASTINHSCRPNCVPTFWLRPSSPPVLQITVCRSVNVGDELSISYCDTSTPRHIRRGTLWENYKFVCQCSSCTDTKRDDDVVGLKCTTNNCCKGRVESIAMSTNDFENRGYKCNSCGNTDFDCALKAQSDSIVELRHFESTMNDSNYKFDNKDGEDIRKVYENLKQYCKVQSSYYSVLSADVFIYWCSNALKYMNNEQEQLGICHGALVVMNESRLAAQLCMKYPGKLSWHVKRGMEAKLRLFVNPMDMEALEMLQNVRKEFLLFYHSSDEMILSLEESLAAYSFS